MFQIEIFNNNLTVPVIDFNITFSQILLVLKLAEGPISFLVKANKGLTGGTPVTTHTNRNGIFTASLFEKFNNILKKEE